MAEVIVIPGFQKAVMEVPDYSVVMGTPGKVVKQLPEDYKRELEKVANTYVHLGEKYTKEAYKGL